MYDQILAARQRLAGIVHRTPVLSSRTLNERVGCEVLLKCENLQRVGAFKIRGAYNAIAKLSDAERMRGVITHSSGNHAQGVALASKLLGVRATIVMPANAPAIKLAATRDYGATVVLYDPEIETREAISMRLAAEHGYVLIPPYDHPDIVAGQGTAAHELLTDYPQITTLLTPCGGGGLLSGSAIAARGLNPACRTIGVEPELADDATRSFHTKTLHTVKNPPTIADGTRTPSLGKITFPLVLEYVADMVTVSESEIMRAVQFLFYRMKIVVEPSGALGVAALLFGKVRPPGAAGVIISGGNVDAETMTTIFGAT